MALFYMPNPALSQNGTQAVRQLLHVTTAQAPLPDEQHTCAYAKLVAGFITHYT